LKRSKIWSRRAWGSRMNNPERWRAYCLDKDEVRVTCRGLEQNPIYTIGFKSIRPFGSGALTNAISNST